MYYKSRTSNAKIHGIGCKPNKIAMSLLSENYERGDLKFSVIL
jgi:hypothetical protein